MTEQKFTDTDDVEKSDQGANDPVINPMHLPTKARWTELSSTKPRQGWW